MNISLYGWMDVLYLTIFYVILKYTVYPAQMESAYFLLKVLKRKSVSFTKKGAAFLTASWKYYQISRNM